MNALPKQIVVGIGVSSKYTLEALKELCPGVYLKGLDSPDEYYYFTGGGSVLKAIEEGSPFGLRPVQALLSK